MANIHVFRWVQCSGRRMTVRRRLGCGWERSRWVSEGAMVMGGLDEARAGELYGDSLEGHDCMT